MNGTNCLMIVTASSVNMFKNKTNRYLIRVGYTYMKHFWTLDKAIGFLVFWKAFLLKPF